LRIKLVVQIFCEEKYIGQYVLCSDPELEYFLICDPNSSCGDESFSLSKEAECVLENNSIIYDGYSFTFYTGTELTLG
jgi:hypothetical protein